MSVKSGLLRELEANRGGDVSGQALADKLHVSRNAVWKAVRALREEGYEILSGTNKGYRLADSCDVLSSEGIAGYLPAEFRGLSVFSFKELDSTNNEAKRILAGGCSDPFLVVAEAQTRGRGRRGRDFYSPEGTGLYMTLVIHPGTGLGDAVSVTTAAAVAVVRVIKELTGREAQIKWVNDVWLEGKKICGILTEAVSDCESGTAQSLIIGIGVNVRTEGFPEELRDIAGSLEAVGVTRNRLAAEIAGELLGLSRNLADRSYMEEYREHSLVLGRAIEYEENGIHRQALALAIDDAGGLVVRREDGSRGVLRSGEISLRLSVD